MFHQPPLRACRTVGAGVWALYCISVPLNLDLVLRVNFNGLNVHRKSNLGIFYKLQELQGRRMK